MQGGGPPQDGPTKGMLWGVFHETLLFCEDTWFWRNSEWLLESKHCPLEDVRPWEVA